MPYVDGPGEARISSSTSTFDRILGFFLKKYSFAALKVPGDGHGIGSRFITLRQAKNDAELDRVLRDVLKCRVVSISSLLSFIIRSVQDIADP